MRQHAGDEHTKFWNDPSLGGIDLLRAHFIDHRFGRHAHEEFVIAVFERGAERFSVNGSSRTAAAGSVLIIPPGVAHTGCAASEDGWVYRAFYPSVPLLQRVSRDLFGRDKALDELPLTIFQDSNLHHSLLRAHQSLEIGGSALDREVSLNGALACFFQHAFPFAELKAPGRELRAVKLARDYIHAHYADAIDGSDVAAAAGLSLAHLMRVFQRATNVPINVYLTTVRLMHARSLLLCGQSATDVAVAVGFVDQSHLIRRFRDAFGVTPGRYARDSMIVQ